MSVHGNQNILPLFIRKNTHLPPIKEKDELTLAFHLLTKDMNKGKKILSFSRLLWPFLCVPGVISTHIILDGLMLFSKEGKYSNPPRQPLIGHLLRNVEKKTEIEVLNGIIDVLSFKDVEKRADEGSEESEYQKLRINSLAEPNFLQALLKILPDIKNKPISNYVPLNTALSTDQGLDISEQYRNTVSMMQGNGSRWMTQAELINNFIDKELIEINVKISDINARYKNQLRKASSSIDNTQVEEEKGLKGDNIDNWKVIEKKKVIESITTLFKTIERKFEEIIKKNRFYTRENALKTKVFEDIVPRFENHFNYLLEEESNIFSSTKELHEQYQEIIKKASKIDFMATQKLQKHEADLHLQLQDRNQQLKTINIEKDEAIKKIEALKIQIEEKGKVIIEKLQEKNQECLADALDLIKWSAEDDKSNFFSIPIQWMYLPVYAMFIEDEDMMEETMNLIFPGYVGDSDSLYVPISEAFTDLNKKVLKKMEDDMVLRSNFEFSCENKNLLKDPELKKNITTGISLLKRKELLNNETEEKIKNSLNLID